MVTSRDALLPPELARRFRELHNLEVERRTLGDLLTREGSQAPTVDNLFSREPTGHEVEVGMRRGYTHCALDAFLLPFLLDEVVELRSASPLTGTVVEVRLSTDDLEVSHAGAVMSYGVAREGDGPAHTVACPFINLFPSEAEYQLWRAAHPEALTVAVPVQEAFALARERSLRAEPMAIVECPVCEHCEVDTGTAEYMVQHGATTYYFCEERCQTQFLEDPERYVVERVEHEQGGTHAGGTGR